MFKRFLERKREKTRQRFLRMNSEIICAIANEVDKEFKKGGVNIPAFLEVKKRYKALKITTPKTLITTYRDFYNQGAVSGVEL